LPVFFALFPAAATAPVVAHLSLTPSQSRSLLVSLPRTVLYHDCRYDISIERVQSTVSGASLDTYNLKEPYFRAFSNPTTFAGGSTAQQLDVAAQDSQGHGDAL